MSACCATVARMFMVRKKRYCVMIGASTRAHNGARGGWVVSSEGEKEELVRSMRAQVM